MLTSKKFTSLKNQSNIILHSRFLKKLSPLERYEFLQLCHRRGYRQGEYIYHQGDPGTGMYILEKGQIELLIEFEDEHGRKPSCIVDAPESFGAFSVGYDIRRKSSARCLSDCSLFGFFKPDFDTLRDRHPRIAIKFLEMLNISITKELELSLEKLVKVTGMGEAYSIQFDHYLHESP
ncbi:MAG: cyclic nucleotide-binding domain-containing protein [Balneolales bacterium]